MSLVAIEPATTISMVDTSYKPPASALLLTTARKTLVLDGFCKRLWRWPSVSLVAIEPATTISMVDTSYKPPANALLLTTARKTLVLDGFCERLWR